MRTSLFLLLAFSGMMPVAFAQLNNSVGISAGATYATINQSSLYITGVDAPIEYKQGWTADLTYRRVLMNFIVLEGALDFSQKGYKQTMQYVDENGNMANSESTARYTLNYMGASVKAGVQYGSKWFGQTTVGITPSLLLSSRYKSEAISYPGGETIPAKEGNTEDITDFDLSLNFETAAGYRLSERSSITLTAGYNLGIYDVEPDFFFFIPLSWRNNYFSARVGYQYHF